jgi:hypothetical protein
MRGAAQSDLMRRSDGSYYVVKFQNNPQGLRILANELLATRLAARIGLPVPKAEIIDVREDLTANAEDLVIQLWRGPAAIESSANWNIACEWKVSPSRAIPCGSITVTRVRCAASFIRFRCAAICRRAWRGL